MTGTRPIRSPTLPAASCSPRSGAPLLRLAEDVVGGLEGLEALGGVGIARRGVGVVQFGETAVGGLDVVKGRVDLHFQYGERLHLLAAAAAVAGARPALIAGLLVAIVAASLVGFAPRRVFGGQAFEIIPVLVVFSGVGFTKIPALGAVRGLGRGPVSGVVAAVAVAEAHRLCAPGRTVFAPAGKAPVV